MARGTDIPPTPPPSASPRTYPVLELTVDGRAVQVPDDGASLLEVLRDRVGSRSPKDGCSPQGQCGCCTVLVDGQPRVSCVTPARRVRGRAITTLDGLDPAVRDGWAARFAACGASQCGFCTPGIIVRLAALATLTPASVEAAMVAHLCRCTGWRTIVEAALSTATREVDGPSARAALEGRTPQTVGPAVALGRGGFADDTAPDGALVAVPAPDGTWVVGATLSEARAAAGKVQGRRTTAPLRWPLAVPDGDWDLTLQTTWVEPAYLEPDAAWCEPGGSPVGPLTNGGAFGGKVDSPVGAVARRLADEHRRPVRVVMAREDVVRLGPKRPPIAAGVRRDGTGTVRVVRTPGVAAHFAGFDVEEVDVAGPLTSTALRGAGWVEAAVLRAAIAGDAAVVSPEGAWATATVTDAGISVQVAAGPPLDETVLRSYCIGAAHQALGWVTSEGIAVDDEGVPHDLTIRSFGILRARDTPPIDVTIVAPSPSGPGPREPVNGSDAVFAAVAAAVWMHKGLPPAWPTDTRRNA